MYLRLIFFYIKNYANRKMINQLKSPHTPHTKLRCLRCHHIERLFRCGLALNILMLQPKQVQ